MKFNRIQHGIVLAFLLVALTAFYFPNQEKSLKASMEEGEKLYVGNCLSCHMVNGEGISGVFPPLAKSDYLMKDQKRSIQQILDGASGAMTVNGVEYNGSMSGFNLNDEEVADLLNYIQNSWGNKAPQVTPKLVAKSRK